MTDADETDHSEREKTLPRNLRVAEFCERVPMGKSLFWELVKAKKIRVIKFGSLTVIPFAEAERLLREGTH
jgi:hypothetical protein